ncbi:MAG: hypothetical protein RLZZ292_1712 [Bacteroidota bacterium]|jgi:hypothetical protein
MNLIYPKRLLPTASFDLIDFDTYPSNAILIRHTEQKAIWDENNELGSEHLAAQTDHLKDYSTNLLGTFLLEDIRYKILKTSASATYFMALCQPIQAFNPQIPIYQQDFTIELERGYFLLRTDALHKKTIRYDEIEGEEFTCAVIHTPINANIWHCSLRWFSKNGEDSSVLSKSQRRRMLGAAKSYIIKNAFSY